MIPFTDILKLGAGLGAGLIVGASLAYPVGHLKGTAAGKEEMRADAAVEALDRIENMEDNNENFSKLPDRERCRVFLRDSGLPIDRCDQR